MIEQTCIEILYIIVEGLLIVCEPAKEHIESPFV